MSKSHRTILAAAAVVAAGCRSSSSQLGSESAAVRVSPASLDFGQVFVGAGPQQLLSVVNSGGAPDAVTVAPVSGAAFSAASGTFTLAGGAAEGVTVTFVPTQPGPVQATLHVSWTAGSTDVALSGVGLAWPDCVAQGPCGAATFDPQSGLCSQTTQPDGTACSDSAGCLTDASCHGGQCLGSVASCDDGDACTTDECVIGQGCVHTPLACPGSDNPCEAASCDPIRGCVTGQLSDGTPCASSESCQTASVCLSGACTGTPVPNGTPCSLGWAPCASDATCKAGSCNSPTADGYQPGDVLWTAVGLGSQGGLALDADGGVYFVASGGDAADGHVVGLDRCGNPRWTSSLAASGDVMLDGDQLVAFDATGPVLLGIGVTNGEALWQLPLAPALSSICPANDFQTGSEGRGGASLSAPVMSAQGQIFLAGNCSTETNESAAFLLAVFRDGSVDWLVPAPRADTAPVVDPSGNLYFATSNGDGSLSLSSFNPSGVPRFAAVSYGGDSTVQLVVGSNQVVDIANGQAFGLDGSALYNLDVETGPFANAFYDSIAATGGALDGSGNAYFPYSGAGALEWGGVSPSGSLLWSLAFSSGDKVASYPVLSAEGTLIAVESEIADDPDGRTTPPPSLVAIDSSSGALLWSKQLGSANGTSSLAFGSGGMLLVAGSSVQSIFAGQLHVATTAPWSRYRGGNANGGAALGP